MGFSALSLVMIDNLYIRYSFFQFCLIYSMFRVDMVMKYFSLMLDKYTYLYTKWSLTFPVTSL